MHNERTLRNLEASIEALKEIIDAQRAYIRAVEHERDLFAEGYWAAVKRCEEIDATTQPSKVEPVEAKRLATMRSYILLQYMHGERPDDPLSMAGTFDDLREAQASAAIRLCDVNEIIDTNDWTVVWRFNKHGTRP